MNSKKIFTAGGFSVFFFLMQCLCLAQADFTYPQGSGKFNIVVPPTDPNRNPAQYYSLFLETGDGRYQKLTLPDGSNTTLKILPYNYPISGTAVLTLSAYYDTTPRPPRDLANQVSNSSRFTPPAQNILQGARIGIDPCVPSVVPGDTMAIALIYKPFPPAIASGTKNVIAFYYNMPNNGGDFFSVIGKTTSYKFGDSKVKAIRNFHGEKIYESTTELQSNTSLAVVDSFQSLQSIDHNMARFDNVLYFEGVSNSNENNIFLSLAPDADSTHYGTGRQTNFRAAIIQYDTLTGAVLAQHDTVINLQICFFSRDPNGVAVFPHCFKGPEGKLVSDSIFFQNDGGGDARDVHVKVSIPVGMEFPNPDLVAYLHIRGTKVLFTNGKLHPSDPNIYFLKQNNREIDFNMKNIGLFGTRSTNDISKRKAAITFKIRINRNRDMIPDTCMYTTASIIFTNADTNSPNKAITVSDSFRKNCASRCE